jgi:flagellin-like protein
MTKRMIKSRKAISPILATLLLVVIAVAAIVVTYAWIMTYMGNASRRAEVTIYRANTNFYQNGTLKIDVDIGDSGTQATTLTALYVGNSTSTLVSQTITQATVSPNQPPTRITINYNWTSSVIYYFRTLTSGGLILDWTDQAPVS